MTVKKRWEAGLDAYVHRLRAQKRSRQIGISVGVVVGVLMLGLIFWYLRRRSKKLAAARVEGRVAELELETRRKGDVQGEQASKC
jgi:LPXTG-motif cell wall-anchored protein